MKQREKKHNGNTSNVHKEHIQPREYIAFKILKHQLMSINDDTIVYGKINIHTLRKIILYQGQG